MQRYRVYGTLKRDPDVGTFCDTGTAGRFAWPGHETQMWGRPYVVKIPDPPTRPRCGDVAARDPNVGTRPRDPDVGTWRRETQMWGRVVSGVHCAYRWVQGASKVSKAHNIALL